MSQHSAILSHLKSGRTITPLDALRLYGCMRLAARVHDLKARGNDIVTRQKELKSGKKVAEYILINRSKKA